MVEIFARKALIQKGWAENVRLVVKRGRLESVEEDARPGPHDTVVGIVIPGLANAHSHAFQRALAGRTEERSPAGRDNFWTWRERMYALAAKIDPQALTAIATQAYNEMLASGYTSVAEFHYLHRAPDAARADESMFLAITNAARLSGIRLTYVPVLYERAGFESPQPLGSQQLFALDIDEFLEHQARAAELADASVQVAAGVHSLRAVTPASLQQVADLARRSAVPVHLHIAEQQREVDECLSSYGRRPVRWLLENLDVDESWCLVHATHMDAEESASLARVGAVVCLCPSTEANLGDGLFNLHRFLEAGGRIAIGSDSHISINPFEELRWLEYGQRLATQSRNIAALEEAHVGRELFMRALHGGVQACGQGPDAIVAGAPADLVVLDDDDPMLVGHDATSLLDALVFSGYRMPIERVMVNGEWRVIDGEPVGIDESSRNFAAAVQDIGIAQ
jgi:formimidoylglutamate deiminase